MPPYPKELLPNFVCSTLIPSEEVLPYSLVRETVKDIYSLQEYGLVVDDVIKEIVAPQPSLREVFELSLFLYGYYNDTHVGIRAKDDTPTQLWFQLFLRADRLYNRTLDFFGENFLFSFSHKPTESNYWHFQLWTQDKQGNVVPRDKSNNRLKKLAKHLLENVVLEAVCPKSDVKPFQRDDFDKAINQAS